MSKNNTEVIDEDNVLDFYDSLDKSFTNSEIIPLSIDQGVFPSSVRFGIMKGTVRGSIQDIKGQLYYFSYVPDKDFILVKADTPDKLREATFILEKSRLGFTLMKGGAAPSPPTGGQSQSGGVLPEDEDQVLREQEHLTTQQHPGGAGSESPDLPGVGRDWHGDQKSLDEEPTPDSTTWSLNSLLKGLTSEINNSLPPSALPASDNEVKFMTTVLGIPRQDIIEKNLRLNPAHYGKYNDWLTKAVRASSSPLAEWLKKR